MPSASPEARIRTEHWQLARPFKISRGSRSQAEVVVVELVHDGARGRGECAPTARYGESLAGVIEQLEQMTQALREPQDWLSQQEQWPAGAARNALDCAVWDLRAKATSKAVWELLGATAPQTVQSVYTISLDTPAVMATMANEAAEYPILKLKLGAATDDIERVRAVRTARPDVRLIADVNEGWSIDQLRDTLPELGTLGIEMLEQPLPAGDDEALREIPRAERPMPIGADESCHTRADLQRCAQLYDLVNIKLDKTGGLTEALRLHEAARQAGLGTMVGCMLGTSLAMAPAHLLAQHCDYIDIDAPILLARDRDEGLHYRRGQVDPASRELWG